MSAQIINGHTIANQLLDKVKVRIKQRALAQKRTPSLAVILLGEHAASLIYVRNKRQACAQVGIHSKAYNLPDNTSESALVELIHTLNDDPSVDGILVQAPLPSWIDNARVFATISPAKDVDGFHPYNIGCLALRQPKLRCCTPFGVIKMLETLPLNLVGLHAVVVGASNHVGRPMALELLLQGCTVTVCHHHTQNLSEIVKTADVVVAAAGRPSLIRGDWIKSGATVIDIGITRLENGEISGDVEFQVACQHAAFISPVPGGVGPMTVATLMENTLTAIELREGR